jgi:hypothetical protein
MYCMYKSLHKLLFNGTLAHQRQCLRLYLLLNHVPNELFGHLFEHFFSKLREILRVEVFELDELHDVTEGRLPPGIPYDLAVTVELDHIREVRLADPHDDYTQGVLRALHY